MRQTLLIVLLVSLGGAADLPGPTGIDANRERAAYDLYRSYRKQFSKVLDISPFQAAEKLKEGEKILFVDVRKKKEREVSVIPGAISKKEFKRLREDFRGHLIIPYCTIGYRSGKYARKLARAGFEVRNLAGGIILWAHQVGSFEHRGKPTRRIHVYGKKWDLAPISFKSVR